MTTASMEFDAGMRVKNLNTMSAFVFVSRV